MGLLSATRKASVERQNKNETGKNGILCRVDEGKFHKKVSLKMGVEGSIRDLSVRSVAWENGGV
ncbi:hypothetical protein [Bartonella sp. MM73XJBT.G]|uniref:hypothetical protein n=1 Tax=Bartonella sp. MM73XJBT.G TaxID=3019097 RepID=UPI0023604A66|nr:hypothetical protein [Bartonella sp. MM73XJBT.G]